MKLVLPALAVTLGLELATGAKMMVRPPAAHAAPSGGEDDVRLEPVAVHREYPTASAPREEQPETVAACVPEEGGGCLRAQIVVSEAVRRAWTERALARGDEDPVLALESFDVEIRKTDEDDGGAGRYEVASDGTFDAQLPAGTYAITTTSADDELVSWSDGVKLTAGEVTSLTIGIELSQPISGTVRAPDDIPADGRAVARARGTGRTVAAIIGPGRRFSIGPIPAGEYDVTVVRGVLRPHVIKSVSAPSHLAVEIGERRAVLRGRVGGFETCDSENPIRVEQNGQEPIDLAIEPDCTFGELVNLPAGEVRLSTTIAGREIVHTTYIPEHGDPPPVCLRGPCDGLPGALLLRVQHSTGEPVSAIVAVWSRADHFSTRQYVHGHSMIMLRPSLAGVLDIVAHVPAAWLARTQVPASGGITDVTLVLKPATTAELEAVAGERSRSSE